MKPRSHQRNGNENIVETIPRFLGTAIKISSIASDAGTQTRASINEETVSDYAERMLAGDTFPPVVLFHDGASYFLGDGFHRLLAAQRNDLKDIVADVRKGTRTDALKYSLGANHSNGLRRTNADKKHAVELALKEFADLSDRAIAALCGVSQPFVGSVRPQVITVITSSPHVPSVITSSPQVATVATSTRRKGRDGKSYPAPEPKTAIKTDPDTDTVSTEVTSTMTQPTIITQGPCLHIPQPREHAPEDTDSDALWGLKRYWRSASKKERDLFQQWIKDHSSKTNTKPHKSVGAKQ